MMTPKLGVHETGSRPDDTGEKLVVTVHPRSWQDAKKDFEEDIAPLNGQDRTFTLDCPNFCGDPDTQAPGVKADTVEAVQTDLLVEEGGAKEAGTASMSEDFASVLLRFFRDLAPGQRLRVLVRLGELPDDWTDELSHAIECQVVDNLAQSGKLNQLSDAISWVVTNDGNGGK